MSKEKNNLERGSRSDNPVRLLSLDGACKYLSCGGDLLEELIGLGYFPVIRLGPEPAPGKRDRRKRWVDRLDLDQFIEERKTMGQGKAL
jgi:hypothetical protein